MIGQVFFSYRMEFWVDQLIEELDDRRSDLDTRIILVPNLMIKQWLLLEIAKRKGIAMGLKVIEIEQLLPPSIHSLLMATLIYKELKNTADPDVLAYIGGKKRRLIDLTEELAALFFTYGQFGQSLFEKKPLNWQEILLQKLFCQGPFRLPVQTNSGSTQPIICFGIDFLPPVYWDFLFRSPSLSLYLFSPCIDFWEDLSSDRERKRLNRMWKKRGASQKGSEQLDGFLREGPRNLANWGKIGRETLKNLDRFEVEIDELYPAFEPDSLLKRIQYDLLTFQETKNPQIDSSVRLFLTGSSKLKEIQCLRDEIIRLQIPYSEISVLAPDIEPYVPLIQYVFGEEIPYRISGFDIAPQSSFRQGLIQLIELGSARWDVETVLTLFETPSFYRKQGWDRGKLEELREWVSHAKIKWGIDQNHRQEFLKSTLGEKPFEDLGSWEKGLDFLLHSIVYFSELHIDCDLFEECIGVIERLKQLSLSGEKTLPSWADSIESAAEQFLIIDEGVGAFRQFLADLRNFKEGDLFPLDLIKRFLLRPYTGQIHPNHLHAVRCAPLREASLIPAKALFLIGMDEEQFPRERRSSSLDLLKGAVPESADHDRYCFLQALFSAQEFLRISYGHLSPEEGKPVGPSLLVQELLNGIDLKPEIYQAPSSSFSLRTLSWPRRFPSLLPVGEMIVPIADLRLLARNPWKFYLQKGLGIYIDQELEDSFALQKGLSLRSTLDKPFDTVVAEGKWPLGPIGKALQCDVAEKAGEWKEQLSTWQIEPFTLVLRQNCKKAGWESGQYIVPPIELRWENLKVSIVGQIQYATHKGLICPNEDTIFGSLKAWPEALMAAIILNVPQILMLRNGKLKKFNEPEKSLKAFLEYYFVALQAPSPLLSDWAGSLLLKGSADLEKKMEKGATFEDPVVEWVLARAEIPEAREIVEEWGPLLKETFKELIELYPARNHAAV